MAWNPRFRRLLSAVMVLILAVLSCGQRGNADDPVLVASATPGAVSPGTEAPGTEALGTEAPLDTSSPQAVGYLTREVTLTDRAGNTARVPLHLWYPADAGPGSYTYRTVSDDLKTGKFASQLALSGPVSPEEAPYPLVLFFHGAFTCGTQSLFLTEHLARQGFIVVAPDFPDPLRMCGAWERTDSRLKVLGGLRDIKRTDEEEGLAMLEDSFRVPGAHRPYWMRSWPGMGILTRLFMR